VLGDRFRDVARRVAALTLTSAIALVAVFVAAPPSYGKDKILVVTSGQGSLAATAYIARQLGYFDSEGLDVTVIDGGGGSNAVNTLVGGGAQIGLVGIKLASQAVEKGQPLKVVGTAIQGFPNYLVVQRAEYEKSGLTPTSPLAAKVAFLKGKTIAVNDIGGSSGEFARYVLNAAQVPADKVTLINMTSTAGRLAALKRGRIDAIIGGQPEPETAIAGGYGVMLVNPKADLPGLGKLDYMVQVVRADYLKQNPAIVEHYLRAIKRSEDLVKDHPDEAKRAFFAYELNDAHGGAIDPAIADEAWKNMLAYFPDTLRLEPAQVAAARKFFDISAAVSDTTFIDNGIADRVLAGK